MPMPLSARGLLLASRPGVDVTTIPWVASAALAFGPESSRAWSAWTRQTTRAWNSSSTCAIIRRRAASTST
eukprot:181885-Pyramimonas_sp.AAC.1